MVKAETKFEGRSDPFAIIGLRLLNKKLYSENKKLRQENRALYRVNHRLSFWNEKYRDRRKEEYLNAIGRPSDEKIVWEFVTRFCKLIDTWNPDEREHIRYEPKKNSKAYTMKEHYGFKVIYSLAKKSSCNTAVASWWVKKQGSWVYKHMDLTSAVEVILKYYQRKTYDPYAEKEIVR